MSYYLEDANDSISALTNNAGVKTQTYAYDAFGNVRPGSDPPQLGFHAAWHDPSSGLIDMRARSYDPQTGRFTAPDPVAPDPQAYESFHPYAFANHNPHVFSDPTGGFSLTELNVTQVIQQSLQQFRAGALNVARREAKNQIKEFSIDFLAQTLSRYIPGNIFTKVFKSTSDDFKLGGIFHKDLNRFFEGLPFAENMWFEPSLTESGYPVANGINPIKGGVFKIVPGTHRPDLLFASVDHEPLDFRKAKNRAWLVAEFKLNATGIYNQYFKPGAKKTGQWLAITNFARERQTVPVALFVTYNPTTKANERIIEKEAVNQGVALVLATLRNKKR